MVEKCCSWRLWPASYVGLPGVLFSIAIVLFTIALLLQEYGEVPDFVSLPVVFTGILLALLSVGRGVDVVDGKIILTYGYPRTVFKLTITDVVEVADVNNLEKGRLFKYFKVQLIPLTIIIAYPLLYIIVKASLPPVRYLTFFLIPIFVGLGLIVYFMLTSESYRRFAKYTGWVLSFVLMVIDFLIGSYYHQLFDRLLTSDMTTLLPLMIGQVLVFIFFIFITVLRRHVIILEDTRGRYYAVVAVEEEARQFIELVERRVMTNA